MAKKTAYTPGQFCFTDLQTSDPSAAKAFYTALFGWTAVDLPVPGGTYTMLKKGEDDVAALGGMSTEDRSRGIPPHWNVYVSTENADATAAKAAALGAKVIAPAFDVMDVGRMAVIADPTGAFLCLWQPRSHIGAGRYGEPGALCWCELQTNDVDRAKAFYTSLFGWTAGGDAHYTEWVLGSDQLGGMMKIDPSWGPVPPNWSPYFMVESVEASTEKARSLGAKVMVPPKPVGTMGRFAVLGDPQGAVFSLYQHLGG